MKKIVITLLLGAILTINTVDVFMPNSTSNGGIIITFGDPHPDETD